MSDSEPSGLESSLERIAAKHRASGACEPDEWDHPDLAAERRIGVEAMRARLWANVVPSRFLWANLADFEDPDQPAYYQPTAVADLRAWAERPSGRNLILGGPIGTGKTHGAIAAARLRFDHAAEVRFLPSVELLDLLRPGGPEGALYDLADVDVLVIDDIASERATDWTHERMYALVNRRWMEERPTVATTNLPATRAVAPAGWAHATLDEAVGLRTFSRLVGNGAVWVEMVGPDRRRPAAETR